MNPLIFSAGAKAIGALAFVAVVAVGAYRAGHRHAADAAQAELSALRTAQAEAAADHAARVAEANARAVRAEADAEQRIAAARRAAQRHTITAQEVIRDTPEFAAVVRPADLQRVRDDQLDAIAAAAARAADLSASGIPAVRSADAVGAGHGRQ